MSVNFNFSKRTKILAAVAALLAVVCVLQFFLGLKSPQKTFKLKSAPDYISVENSEKSFVLQKNDDGEWFCGTEKMDTAKIEILIKSFSPLTTLGVTSRSASGAALERYGLDKPVLIRAKAKNKELLSIAIGKDSSSGSQSYVQLDGKKEIYLARGNLRTAWDIDKSALLPAPEPAPDAKAEEAESKSETDSKEI